MSEVIQENKEKGTILKNEGNKLLQEGHFEQSIAKYGEAISLWPSNAIFYANRAQAHLKMENYGAALEDADMAIELDNSYAKAYHRRGSVRLCQGKYKQALPDFKKVCVLLPKDRSARDKLKEVQTLWKRVQFEAAIAVEHKSAFDELGDVNSYPGPDADYDGPHLPESGPTPEFARACLTHFKAQKLLHRKYVLQLLVQMRDLLQKSPTLQRISFPKEGHFTVCGDTHGQFYDVANLFEQLNGLPSENNPYLMNGDFVDRGSFSVEVILTMFIFKLTYPNSFFLNRGNHETVNMGRMYGFHGEVTSKYSSTMVDLFTEVFRLLPLAAVINDKVFVVHGGLFSQDGVKLSDLEKIDRNMEPPESGLMCDVLWSDPAPEGLMGRSPSKRGCGIAFGRDVTTRFLDDNKLQLVIRSHEVKDEGYAVQHGGKLITVFSAPNYCDSIGNKGAYCKLTVKDDGSIATNLVSYDAVPHPDIKPMAYAGGFGSMMGF